MDDSDFSRSIHETGNGLHRAGILTDAELREIETACLLPTVLPEEIRALREREALSRADLAYDFHVSPDLVGRWERGKSTPSPVALKLLDLVRRKGINAIR